MGEWFIRMKAAAHKARSGQEYQELVAADLLANAAEHHEDCYRCHVHDSEKVVPGEQLLVTSDDHGVFQIAQDARIIGQVDEADSDRLRTALAKHPEFEGMGVFLVVAPAGLDGSFECMLMGDN